MNPTDGLEKQIQGIRVRTTDALDQRILADASAVLERLQSTQVDAHRPSIWGTIMKSNWLTLTAALLIAATVITITFHRQMVTVAYALEQTLEANRGLRYIHIRVEPSGEGLREVWAEFGEDGKLLRLRMIALKTEDGAKEAVWQEGKAEVWFKTKGHVLVIRDKKTAEKISKELVAFGPKVVMEQLYEAQAKGKVNIETREPSADNDQITLVVSFNDSPNKREVYQINPQTRLVEQFEKYHLVDGRHELMHRVQYLEYNQEVPPGTFVLDVPAEVTRIDWTTQEVGLPKGDLTDGQIAMKVARAFFEALIAKDYGRAGSIMSGLPASRMEEAFGKTEFLRIVSVGNATPHPDTRTRFLQVPCEVEIRVGGAIKIEKFTPCIRAVEGQPDRWLIGGGI